MDNLIKIAIRGQTFSIDPKDAKLFEKNMIRIMDVRVVKLSNIRTQLFGLIDFKKHTKDSERYPQTFSAIQKLNRVIDEYNRGEESTVLEPITKELSLELLEQRLMNIEHLIKINSN